MRTILYGQTKHQGWPVCYEILAEELESFGSAERYGLRVRYQEETAEVLDITVSQRRIQMLAEKLLRGGVTPVALRDMVEDWLER